jgi:hypothetical protein
VGFGVLLVLFERYLDGCGLRHLDPLAERASPTRPR